MSLIRAIKERVKCYRQAKEEVDKYQNNKLWWNNYARLISPPSIDATNPYLIKMGNFQIKCLVVGTPQLQQKEGYPAKLKETYVKKLLNAGIKGANITVTLGVIPIPIGEAHSILERAITANSINQSNAKEQNEAGQVPLHLQLSQGNLASNTASMFFGEESMHHTFQIITITADSAESMREAESHIRVALQSHRVLAEEPIARMLETWLCGQAFPFTEEFTFVQMFSSLVSKICPLQNPNVELEGEGEEGLLFGENKETHREIVVDLNQLAAQHMLLFGATGSGKTFTILLYLMRFFAMGRRVIYMTVKSDTKTHYRATANYFKNESSIIDIGRGKNNINPLQIMFDPPEGIEDFSAEWASAYDHHKLVLMNTFKVLFKGDLPPQQVSLLDESLTEVYKRAGITRYDQESHKKAFPLINDHLRAYWEEIAGDKDAGLKRTSAESLLGKTFFFGDDGALSFVNKPTNADFSANFIVVDLSNVPEIAREAFNVLVTAMLTQRFRTDASKGTTIAIDEGGAFLRSPDLTDLVLKSVTQGRSYDIGVIFGSQQPEDVIKAGLSAEMLTNMHVKIALGNNITNDVLPYISSFFKLDEATQKKLKLCNSPGQGILKIGNNTVPINIQPTDAEYRIIKNLDENDKAVSDSCEDTEEPKTRIMDKYESLAKNHQIVVGEWVEGSDPTHAMKMLDYQYFQIQSVAGRGRVNVWVSRSIVKEEENGTFKVKNQSLDHYGTVAQLAGLLVNFGFSEVQINVYGDVDVSGVKDAVRYGFEYEVEGTHKKGELIEKKDRAIGSYDVVKFIGASKLLPDLREAVGPDFVIGRGQAVIDYLISVSVKGEETGKVQDTAE